MTDLRSSLIRRALLFGTVAVVSSCGGSDLVLPGSGFAVLQPLAGQDQVGTVESALPESLVVQVLDAEGAGVAGIRVTWSASGGGKREPDHLDDRRRRACGGRARPRRHDRRVRDGRDGPCGGGLARGLSRQC